ncbi:MAG TPA: ADP-ribosylglycohydrolase family protein [bacterium]|nr:ADP-ribosylglycohydrolase family protein [bacterium]
MEKDFTGKITGSILGLAVGDALGAPVEGAKPGAIRNVYKKITDFVDPEDMLGRGKIYKWRKPGLYTDDTQQALVLLDSLVQDRGVNREKLAERFCDLAVGAEFHFGVYRGSGRNFRISVTDLRQGKPWDVTGRDTAGNGAAKRVAPVAIYYHRNPDTMAEKIAEASLFTHRNPAGISAAIGVGYVIRTMLYMDGLESENARKVIEDTSVFCRQKEQMLSEAYGVHFFDGYEEALHLFSDALMGVAERFDRPQESVYDWIAVNADSHAANRVTRPTLGYAPASVVFSIYSFLKTPQSFEDAIVKTVSEGGDADTNGAMAGAMAGALHGIDGIPERWLKSLSNRKQLKARSEALAQLKWAKSKLENLYEMEYGLTRRESEERLSRMKKTGTEFPQKPGKQKFTEPEPVKEKFDKKRFRKEKKNRGRWDIYLNED